MTTTIEPGTIAHFDFQADIYRGRFRYLEPVAGERSVWLCEYLEPTDDELEVILNDSSPYCGGEGEALERIDRAGQRFVVRVVSPAAWAGMF